MPLTTTYQLKTFLDLYTAVREELKIQSTDTTAINRIKRDLNIVYLEEVVPFAQWKWLRGVFDATVYAAISAGTASVAQGSTVVTLTTAIGSPKDNWLFGIVGYSEVYRIAKHAANSKTLNLQVPYTGTSNATGQYKIWTDEIYLPSFVRETFEITHDFQDQPLENCGLQKYRQYVAALPRAEGRPYFYTTNTYVDPVQYAAPSGLPAVLSRSSNTITKTLVFASDVSNSLQQGDRIQVSGAGDVTYNGEFVIATQSGATITYTAMVPTYETSTSETSAVLLKLQPSSDTRRAKRIQVYPAIFTQNTTLHIDYIREVVGLADDTDEPLMPIGDRTILLYGALNRAWSRERNPEEAKRNFDLFTLKITRMAGKMDDSIDQPRLVPSKIYLGSKRMAQRQKDTRNGLPEGWGGGSSSQSPIISTASRAAQFDSTGALGASTVTTTELARLSGIGSKADGISDSNTLTNKVLSGNTAANLVSGSGTFVFNTTGIITSPNATDTLVGKATSDTLTNKVLSGNTATNLINGSGTFNFSSSGTMTVPSGGVDTLAALGLPQTFTNKTLSGNTATNLINGAGTFNFNSTGTITAPAGTDTLVGLSLIQTLTNKTLTAPILNLPSVLGLYWGASTANKISNYTVAITDDFVYGNSTAGPITFTLPSAVGNTGKFFGFKKSDNSTAAVIISASSAQSIDQSGSFNLVRQDETLGLLSDNANWRKIYRHFDGRIKAYTPVTGGFGSPTINHCFYREAESGIFLSANLTLGTTTSSTAAVGLPTGLQSLSTITNFTSIGCFSDGSVGAVSPMVLVGGSSTAVNFSFQATAFPSGSPIVGSTIGNGALISFSVFVPIQGWN